MAGASFFCFLQQLMRDWGLYACYRIRNWSQPLAMRFAAGAAQGELPEGQEKPHWGAPPCTPSAHCFAAGSISIFNSQSLLRIRKKHRFRGAFSLSKKQYSIFMLRAAARIQSNLLCKFINSGSMYLGIYTREEKMCPQDAVFLRDSLESVVSSERLFGKRSFSTASKDPKGVLFCVHKTLT